VIVGSTWFFGTSLWDRRQSPEYHARVDAFFAQVRMPVDFVREHGAAQETDRAQLRVMGKLGVAYGGFVLALVLIPNEAIGRAAFAFVGAVIGGVGAVLLKVARRKQDGKG
jgi:solute:Na+ symporter, SSS family